MTTEDRKRSQAREIVTRALDLERPEVENGESVEQRPPLPSHETREEKQRILDVMRQELKEADPTLDDLRLETIRERIESGFYLGGEERSVIISRILDDLLGTDPF